MRRKNACGGGWWLVEVVLAGMVPIDGHPNKNTTDSASERDDGEEDGGAVYQPLSTTQHPTGNGAWAAAFGEDEASLSSQDSAFI
uniref:Secreted protein n=1 Tax=Globodera pallida TaxID=36090 RepID=A0A183CE35_GLOPA